MARILKIEVRDLTDKIVKEITCKPTELNINSDEELFAYYDLVKLIPKGGEVYVKGAGQSFHFIVDSSGNVKDDYAEYSNEYWYDD